MSTWQPAASIVMGRPSINPELMIRMLLVGRLYGIRSETRLAWNSACHHH
jgi:transposase